MFCWDINDAEYHIFNKPIDPERFEMLQAQYRKYITEELAYTSSEWPREMLIPTFPHMHVFYDRHYAVLNDKFLRWARTLPNFDEQLLYEMTLNPKVFQSL